MKIQIIVLLLSFSVLAAPPVPSRQTNRLTKLEHLLPTESTNRILLVKPKASTKLEDVDKVARGLGLQKGNQSKRLRWRQFVIPVGKSKADTVTALKQSGLFEHVIEPNTYKTQEIPNDPMFNQLWGMTNIMAPAAWDRIKEAPDVVVAVVDTGIDFTHPDLVDNLWTGPNGEHGYVATNGMVLEGGHDDHGHGTHVAGTIGGVGNNGVGVVGLAWKTRIMAMKVLHHGSGSSLDIVNGYEKLVELKEAGVPVLVSNHSYGGTGRDEYMEDGFRLLAEADIFAAVAAGNSAQDIDSNPFHPASYSFDNMVVAIASDSSGNKAGFSNFGMVGADITAPGVGIWSSTRSNTYSSFSGTSMAAPHVAGVATLLRQLNTNLTALQTREIILHPGSYDPGDFLSSTSGKLNAQRTVNNPKVFENPFITNNPPIITNVTPYTIINNQAPAIIQAFGMDPDGDPLKWGSSLSGLKPFFVRRVLALGGLFISNTNNITVIQGGPFAYQLASTITVGVSDQRGGSALTNSGFEFVRDKQVRRPVPVKTWTAAINSAGSNLVSLTFDVDDLAKTNYIYAVAFNFPSWSMGTYCCTTPSPAPLTFTLGRSSDDFSVRVICMDKWFNYVTTETINYRSNGGVTNIPKCVVTVNTNEGNVPFEITFNMSQSQGANNYAVFDLFEGASSGSGPVQNIQFNELGVYFKTPTVFNTTTFELDFTIVPVFASRFLGSNEPPSKIANLIIQKASSVTGPWSFFTNLTDTINGNTFYRLEAQ